MLIEYTKTDTFWGGGRSITIILKVLNITKWEGGINKCINDSEVSLLSRLLNAPNLFFFSKEKG